MTLIDRLLAENEDICTEAVDRINVLIRERDAAREECGHEKHMRKFVSDERDHWIKKCMELEKHPLQAVDDSAPASALADEREAIKGAMRELAQIRGLYDQDKRHFNTAWSILVGRTFVWDQEVHRAGKDADHCRATYRCRGDEPCECYCPGCITARAKARAERVEALRPDVGKDLEDAIGRFIEDDDEPFVHDGGDIADVGLELPSAHGKTATPQMPGANPVWCGITTRHDAHVTIPGSTWCAGEPTAAYDESTKDPAERYKHQRCSGWLRHAPHTWTLNNVTMWCTGKSSPEAVQDDDYQGEPHPPPSDNPPADDAGDGAYQREKDAHGQTMDALRTMERQANDYYRVVADINDMLDAAGVPTHHPKTGAPCNVSGRVALLLAPSDSARTALSKSERIDAVSLMLQEYPGMQRHRMEQVLDTLLTKFFVTRRDRFAHGTGADS